MLVGESLRRQSLTSLNDAFTLKHFGFDDLILFRNHDRQPLWWSSAFSPADWREKPRGTGVSDVTFSRTAISSRTMRKVSRCGPPARQAAVL